MLNLISSHLSLKREMKPTTKLSIALIILLLAALMPMAQASKPGKTFEKAAVIDLSTGKAFIKGSLIEESNHYYKLIGLRSGVKVIIEAELTGVSSAYLTISLYSADYARLTGYDGVLGTGSVKKVKLEYALSQSLAGGNQTLYLRFGKTRGAFNYSAEISVEYVSDLYPTNPEGDAGDRASTALKAPEISPNKTSSWSGYLSSTTTGEDYEDYYQLKAKLSKGDVLAIIIQPSKDLRLEAALLSADLFPLKTNQSELRGKPVIIKLSGEWEDKPYTFYLKISNFGGTGGEGTYAVKAWIEKPGAQTAQTTTTTVEAPVQESMIKFAIIIAAIALIAISIIILILRRRMYRVEEVGWWGEAW